MTLSVLVPAALLGLIALAAPIAIHILAKRRARRVPFPTLRFIQPGRLASVRRHVLEDAALLGVRLLILAVAVVALAGPLVVTRQREAMWNAQIRTAVVDGAELPNGLRRAVAALAGAPPGRREVVVRSSFPIGSITQADIASVPAPFGLRFERRGSLPSTRTVKLPSVLTESGARSRMLTVDRAVTSIRELDDRDGGGSDPLGPAMSISTAASDRATVDAAVSAVLSQRVLAPRSGRRVRIVCAGAADFAATLAAAAPVRDAWMADAVAAMSRDDDLRAAANLVANGSADARLTRSPWLVIARAGDRRPIAVAAADSGALNIVTAAPVSALATPVLLRAVLNAIGDARPPADAETVAVSDVQLHAWTRAPGPAPPPRLDTVGRDDRRWFWIGVLGLLALEAWMRGRTRREARPSAEGAKVARVA